jgi:hypothetical protein
MLRALVAAANHQQYEVHPIWKNSVHTTKYAFNVHCEVHQMRKHNLLLFYFTLFLFWFSYFAICLVNYGM